MKCPRCHVSLPKNTRFCPSCGLPVESLLAATNKKSDAMPSVHVDAQTRASEQHAEAESVAHDSHEGERVVDVDVQRDAQGTGKHLRDDKAVDVTVEAEDAQDDLDVANVAGASEGDDAPTVDDVAHGHDAPDVEEPYEPEAQATDLQRERVALDKIANDTEAFGTRTKRTSKTRHILMVAAIVCVLALAAWSIFSVREAMRVREEKEQQLQMAEQALSTPKQVDVVLGVPNEESAGNMPVALHVVGVARTGEVVDEVSVVTLEDHTLDLLPGDYDISLVGNAISSEGKMFSGSVDSYKITVALDDEFERLLRGDEQGDDAAAEAVDAQDSNASVTTPPAEFPIFVFGEIASAEVTDEQIDAVRAWMVEAGLDPQPYVNAVIARRTEATNRLNAEATARLEEQMRAAEEVARSVEQQVNEFEQQQESAQPAGEQPASDQPVADQPAAEQPADGQPATDPAANAQVEG